jgi:hypothetical protein
MWTIRKSYGYKYAIECIFIRVTLLNGRLLGYVTFDMEMQPSDMKKSAEEEVEF